MYFITGIHVKKDSSPELFDEQRCFGYYHSLLHAILEVCDNECDIHENYYKYMVIEQIEEGIHPVVLDEVWYVWVECGQCYIPTDRPACVDNYCNFALG